MKGLYNILLIVAAVAAVSCGQRKQSDSAAVIREHIGLMAAAETPEEKEAEKNWAADSLDFNALAESGLWDAYLKEWVRLYRRTSGDKFDVRVTAAAKRLILRANIRDRGNVKPLVRTLCEQLVATKDYAAAAAIAAYPHGFDLPGNTYSEIADRLLGAVMLPGQPAPAIEGAGPMPVPPPEATILLFYETGCRTCGPMIEELKEYYEVLASLNIRVITVSSDTDPERFRSYAGSFPWPDRLCDFKSFSGENFKRYHVPSTPTMYVIDDKGIVKGQYADLDETNLLDRD